MENKEILDELIKGSVDQMVFGEYIYQITASEIRNIQFNSEEYWRLRDEMDSPDAEIVEETHYNVDEVMKRYKDVLDGERSNDC